MAITSKQNTKLLLVLFFFFFFFFFLIRGSNKSENQKEKNNSTLNSQLSTTPTTQHPKGIAARITPHFITPKSTRHTRRSSSSSLIPPVAQS
jgi:hypothetical protein